MVRNKKKDKSCSINLRNWFILSHTYLLVQFIKISQEALEINGVGASPSFSTLCSLKTPELFSIHLFCQNVHWNWVICISNPNFEVRLPKRDLQPDSLELTTVKAFGQVWFSIFFRIISQTYTTTPTSNILYTNSHLSFVYRTNFLNSVLLSQQLRSWIQIVLAAKSKSMLGHLTLALETIS